MGWARRTGDTGGTAILDLRGMCSLWILQDRSVGFMLFFSFFRGAEMRWSRFSFQARSPGEWAFWGDSRGSCRRNLRSHCAFRYRLFLLNNSS